MRGDGVPDCFVRFAECDGRRATIHDSEICIWLPGDTWERFKLLAGRPVGRGIAGHPFSEFCEAVVEKEGAANLAALDGCWAIAEHWVRTGQLPTQGWQKAERTMRQTEGWV